MTSNNVPTSDAIDQTPPLNQVIPGFMHLDEWAWVECDFPRLLPRDGAERLRAEFDCSLTVRQAARIPFLGSDEANGLSIADLAKLCAPYVRAWNVTEFDPETGEMCAAPPPKEIGASAFDATVPGVVVWVAMTLRRLHFQGGPDRPNDETPSAAG